MISSRPAAVRAQGLLRAFTLVEVLLVIMIIAILAAIVYPRFNSIDGEARAKSMSSTVHKVRELLQFHQVSGDYPQVASGYPDQVYAAWFTGGEIPSHTWTGAAMKIDIVDGAANDVYPAGKTFDPGNLAAKNAWYNRTNGSFCALVPPGANDGETLDRFNMANSATAQALNQTTE